MPSTSARRPHVLIVGAGFGGLAAARALRNTPVDVTLIDKCNHHLFQPLLYQVATAALSPAEIAAPIRAIVKNQPNVRVVLDRVEAVEPAKREVRLANGSTIAYDWLVLATGARHSYFGQEEWETFAPGIKSIDDATAVRRKVLLALERAETETNQSRRDALLTFVIVGGGPTGVEMSGAIAELARQSVSKDFRSITPHCSKIVLVQRGDRLLPSFPERLSKRARVALEHLGVEVILGGRVDKIDAEGVTIGNRYVPARTVVWAAGVMASPAAAWLGCEPDAAGRVTVGADLLVPGHDRIFAIGDTAACTDKSGRSLPGVAPVAKQQGAHVAKSISTLISGGTIEPFHYRDRGSMATIGRKHAVASFGRMQMSGHLAWLVWSAAHVFFLAGFRNRFVVAASWVWSYLTYERSARLITGEIAHEKLSTV
jgi:NADH:ubiquinone reductase (H+-translocating)